MLLFGGDTAYPVATVDEIQKRLVGPWNEALREHAHAGVEGPTRVASRREARRVLIGIPDYQNLNVSGEARYAAERMEARAREPASEAMFTELMAPLLTPSTVRGGRSW